MDIMSNMDAARFTSANPVQANQKTKEEKDKKKEENQTPMVIRNLNNQ